MFDIDPTPADDRAPVVFLSGAFGGAGEWTGVAGALGPDFEAIAWSDTAGGLAAVSEMPSGAHLVAHGTAAYPALAAAADAPWALRSLTLVDADMSAALPEIAPTQGIHDIVAERTRFAMFTMEGDAWNAAREEIDFWIGPGAFLASSVRLQRRFAARVGRLADALRQQATQPVDDQARAGVVCPVMLMTGASAPQGLQETHLHLALSLPFARDLRIPGAGVCSHLTDPHLAGPALRGFLARTQSGWQYPSASQSVAA